MLPQFSINATWGGMATSFSQMFAEQNPFWIVTGGVAQTLFAGGTLLHRKRAAEAAFDQAASQYKSTVLTAFQDVADALYALQSDADALKAAVEAERATRKTLDLVTKQLQAGYVNYLALLSAQQTYQQALITLAQARASRFADTAGLFQSLGGGWWNRADAGAVSSTQGSR
jgi:outer membrane protein TolC